MTKELTLREVANSLRKGAKLYGKDKNGDTFITLQGLAGKFYRVHVDGFLERTDADDVLRLLSLPHFTWHAAK